MIARTQWWHNDMMIRMVMMVTSLNDVTIITIITILVLTIIVIISVVIFSTFCHSSLLLDDRATTMIMR